MRFRLALLSGLAIVVAPGTIAQAPTPQPGLSLTVYNGNLSLVQDVRRLDIPAGRSRQEFPDVSAQIRSETVTLTAPDVGIVEQNFDYDLLSPQKLMEKAIGRDVVIVRTNPATGAETRETAKVLAVNGGVVLQIGSRIEVLRDDGLPVRVIFDKVPENLRARPTLSVTVDSARGGPRLARLSYLTPGLGWSADYVVLFDEAKGLLDAQGWVTLQNNTGTTFKDAKLVLVAGSPNGSGMQPQRGWRPPRQQPGTIRQPGTESGNRERLGDYYLYPLAEPTTVANAQTKQVSFLDVKAVPARKVYEYRVEWLATSEEAQSADTVLSFSNSAKGGLGDQLPSGVVRVYMRDAKGQPQFIGESRIGHTSMGSQLSLKTGEAFDVRVRPVVEKRVALSKTKWQTQMSYTLTNARPEPVTVDLYQTGLWWAADVSNETLKSSRRDADTVVWSIKVPANGETKISATFETSW